MDYLWYFKSIKADRMIRTMLKSKIHRARVTGANLDYEGSIAIDTALCSLANLKIYEKVDIYNISTGARFSTYVIPGEEGEICLNGAAARLVQKNDLVIIASYSGYNEEELTGYTPKVILVDAENHAV
jgi:aspartate 1-decarboxylase